MVFFSTLFIVSDTTILTLITDVKWKRKWRGVLIKFRKLSVLYLMMKSSAGMSFCLIYFLLKRMKFSALCPVNLIEHWNSIFMLAICFKEGGHDWLKENLWFFQFLSLHLWFIMQIKSVKLILKKYFRQELMREREILKEEQVEALKRSMQGGLVIFLFFL